MCEARCCNELVCGMSWVKGVWACRVGIPGDVTSMVGRFRWVMTGMDVPARMVSELAMQARFCVRQDLTLLYVVVGRNFDI